MGARSGGSKTALNRSDQMRRIRSVDTKPEELVRKALWHQGLRGYRKHARTPAGRPDLVFPGPRVAVFIDGCFWHGCPEHYVRPRTRNEFWSSKLVENVERDRRQTLELEAAGWVVVRVWEHEVYEALPSIVQRISVAVRDGHDPHCREDWRVDAVTVVDEMSDRERRHLVRLRAPSERVVSDGIRSTRKWKRTIRSG